MNFETNQRFEGICDVCGVLFSYDWDPAKGLIDFALTDSGRVYTWIRHYATAPPEADPKCAVYSSRLYEIPWPREEEDKHGFESDDELE